MERKTNEKCENIILCVSIMFLLHGCFYFYEWLIFYMFYPIALQKNLKIDLRNQLLPYIVPEVDLSNVSCGCFGYNYKKPTS